jgi:hypothetical protein
MYKLAFRSNKKEAEEFTDWVASKVLPAIRKTGKYAISQDQRTALQEFSLQGIDDLMAMIAHKESRKRLIKALQKIDRGYQDVEILALSEAKEQPDLRTELLAYLVTLEGRRVTASYIRQYGSGNLRHVTASELTQELNALVSAGLLQKETLPGKTAPRFFLAAE